MTYQFHAWSTHTEDPVGAAIRADASSYRRVIDTAHDYRGAAASGNKAEAAAAKAAFRQAWESDVRRRGGRPEDFIPDYPNVDPIPVGGPLPGVWNYFFGQTSQAPDKNPIVRLMTTMAILYILWMFLN